MKNNSCRDKFLFLITCSTVIMNWVDTFLSMKWVGILRAGYEVNPLMDILIATSLTSFAIYKIFFVTLFIGFLFSQRNKNLKLAKLSFGGLMLGFVAYILVIYAWCQVLL